MVTGGIAAGDERWSCANAFVYGVSGFQAGKVGWCSLTVSNPVLYQRLPLEYQTLV